MGLVYSRSQTEMIESVVFTTRLKRIFWDKIQTLKFPGPKKSSLYIWSKSAPLLKKMNVRTDEPIMLILFRLQICKYAKMHMNGSQCSDLFFCKTAVPFARFEILDPKVELWPSCRAMKLLKPG